MKRTLRSASVLLAALCLLGAPSAWAKTGLQDPEGNICPELDPKAVGDKGAGVVHVRAYDLVQSGGVTSGTLDVTIRLRVKKQVAIFQGTAFAPSIDDCTIVAVIRQLFEDAVLETFFPGEADLVVAITTVDEDIELVDAGVVYKIADVAIRVRSAP